MDVCQTLSNINVFSHLIVFNIDIHQNHEEKHHAEKFLFLCVCVCVYVCVCEHLNRRILIIFQSSRAQTHWCMARRMTPLIPYTFLFFFFPHSLFLSLERSHHSLLSAAKSHQHRHHHHHLILSHRASRPAAPWDRYWTSDERLRSTGDHNPLTLSDSPYTFM